VTWTLRSSSEAALDTQNRVTGLGEFFSIWAIFLLRAIKKLHNYIPKKVGDIFTEKNMYQSLTKYGLGFILGNFLSTVHLLTLIPIHKKAYVTF
jgi:hypothetical protein